jgi:hypothetical protein
MKATLRYRYARLPQIKLKLKKRPIGTIARRYTRPVMGTFFLESRMVVKRARNWVMMVAKTRCHVVRKTGNSAAVVRRGGRSKVGCIPNLAVCRMYLLKTMVLELSVIHVLRDSQHLQYSSRTAEPTQCTQLGERRQAPAQT